jgi:ABC-type transport system involved in cytochrome c biogenesis permease subunit
MQFISGISLVCFAASYGVAWVLELTQLLRGGAARRVIMLGFVVAGFVAHTLYLGYRAFELSISPLSSNFDWCLVAAWLLMGAYLYLTYYYPRAALGLYMLPLVLALLAGAALADPTPLAPASASRAWGAVHGVFLLLGTVAVMVGFVAGLMYLLQARRLKHKQPPSEGFRLPSLERLAKINGRSIILSVLLVGIGFLAGMVLNVINRGQSGELPWSDPVIWSSGLMLAWLAAAALFNAAYQPARRGQKVAYLTIANFVFLAVALAVLLFVNTEHRQPTQAVGGNDLGAPRSRFGVPCSRWREHARQFGRAKRLCAKTFRMQRAFLSPLAGEGGEARRSLEAFSATCYSEGTPSPGSLARTALSREGRGHKTAGGQS